MENLKIYRSEEDQLPESSAEVLSTESLDKVFKITDIDVESSERRLEYLAEKYPQNLVDALFLLSGYSAGYGIPIPREYEESFLYQRNLKEIEEIKPELYKTLDKMKNGMDLSEINFTNIARLFAIQKKKSDWLESEHYPRLFDRAKEHAIGDVNRFLLDFYNQKDTESEAYTGAQTDLNVLYKDRLNYLLEGNPPESAGKFNVESATVTVCLDTSYGERDEWRVYNVLVHEIVHKVSFQSFHRVGIRDRDENPDREEINEAITEIVTAGIAAKQFDSQESGLHGQSQIEINQRAYFKYILVVQNIFKKIPLSFFVDAMMTEEGITTLEKKFEEEYQSTDALKEFALNLSEMYLPKKPAFEGIYNIKDYREQDDS